MLKIHKRSSMSWNSTRTIKNEKWRIWVRLTPQRIELNHSYIPLGAPARFNAGTGLGGIGKISSPLTSAAAGPGTSSGSSLDIPRPGMKRQDSAPPGMSNGDGTSTNLSTAAARAAEHVNGSLHANTISSGQSSRPQIPVAPSLQASRPIPTANRCAPLTNTGKGPRQRQVFWFRLISFSSLLSKVLFVNDKICRAFSYYCVRTHSLKCSGQPMKTTIVLNHEIQVRK